MMNLVIRSQDKTCLHKCNVLTIEKCVIDGYGHYWEVDSFCIDEKDIKYCIYGDRNLLGIYSSEEKAVKVLDEIEKVFFENIIYKMPTDEEVEGWP